MWYFKLSTSIVSGNFDLCFVEVSIKSYYQVSLTPEQVPGHDALYCYCVWNLHCNWLITLVRLRIKCWRDHDVKCNEERLRRRRSARRKLDDIGPVSAEVGWWLRAQVGERVEVVTSRAFSAPAPVLCNRRGIGAAERLRAVCSCALARVLAAGWSQWTVLENLAKILLPKTKSINKNVLWKIILFVFFLHIYEDKFSLLGVLNEK